MRRYARVLFGLTQLMFAILLAPIAPVLAQTQPTLHEINDINGFKEALDAISKAFHTAPDQIGGQPAPPALKEAWELAQEGAYDPNKMRAAIETALDGRFRPEELAALHEFFASPLGKAVTALEVASAANAVEKKSEGKRLYADLQMNDPQRLDLYGSMLDSLNAIDNSEAMALNMLYSMMAGMAASAKQPLTDEQLQGAVRLLTKNVRAELEQSIYASAAYTYRDLPIDDLKKYVEFLATPAAHRYYDLFMIELDKVVSSEAKAVGNRLMIAFGQRKA